ncbi:hypothetical protein ABW19_dt0203069 [Dactylella cylindrospora]|nr:hypothetical protein ABW19_dt0203069 [Dactylella cylindrospora]
MSGYYSPDYTDYQPQDYDFNYDYSPQAFEIPSDYTEYPPSSLNFNTNYRQIRYSNYTMPPSGNSETYDRIVEFYCIDCGVKHGITLQDYTRGQLDDADIDRLIRINTNYRCPAHEPTMMKSNILVQWKIPEGTMFAEAARLAGEYKIQILCPEKGCGQRFKNKSDFKRHLAGIFRPFYCLRGNCCIKGVPCRKGFGRIEEVINHLKNENGQHHDAVRYRPVEGWDFRKKDDYEIDRVLENITYIPEEEFYAYYSPQY